MKILLLSFYYPPDFCAGSFRAGSLVDALRHVGGANLQIEVITTTPNRYHSNIGCAAEIELGSQLKVQRVRLPSHKSGMVDQSRAFAAFAYKALSLTSGRKWDAIVATSSRLMTAALGARIAARAKVPLYLDIRDLFTDTMSDLLDRRVRWLVLPAFRWLEKFTFNKANRINFVSAGFLPYAEKIAPQHDFRLFTNGIDEEFMEAEWSQQPIDKSDLPLVVYAGNIGQGQGLEKILPDVACKVQDKVRFRVLGDGGRRKELEKTLHARNVMNVEICDPVERSELISHYQEAAILFMHLNDHYAFQKVLPSKIFEYASTQKPILAGVAGYAAKFLKEKVDGAEIFEPCDSVGMPIALGRLLKGSQVFRREKFVREYARVKIMRDLAKDIIDLSELE